MDPDGDHFTNLEEFKAKTNPRDPKRTPPFTDKVGYVQCVKDPLTLKFQTYISDTDLSIRRTEPADKACNTPVEFKVGDSFSAEKGKKVPLQTGEGPASCWQQERTCRAHRPSDEEGISNRVGRALRPPDPSGSRAMHPRQGGREVVALGEEFYFEVNPDIKFTVDGITEEDLVLSYTPEGGEKKTVTRQDSYPSMNIS